MAPTTSAALRIQAPLQKLELSCSPTESRLALQEVFTALNGIHNSSAPQVHWHSMAEIIRRTQLVLDTVAALKEQLDLDAQRTTGTDTLGLGHDVEFRHLVFQSLARRSVEIQESCIPCARAWVQSFELPVDNDWLGTMVSTQHKTLALIQDFWRLHEDILHHR